MKTEKLNYISKLIKDRKIDLAQIELSKLGPEFLKNSEYLYLRSEIFYIDDFLARDTISLWYIKL